ncbi:MAG TPA: molybdopterin molybdotransferase MoeA [Planctomycetota bacterium]|nr:molybdopterin molybdotransferase MoeA [Planctomycetota bacterium]
MITIDEARDAVRQRAHAIRETEQVPLDLALHRVLAAPVRADRADPPFDRASMDGYALRADETASLPRIFNVVGRIAAGQRELPVVDPGAAAWVNTGAPIPPGADTVVPVELTRGNEQVQVMRPAAKGDNILAAGALVRPGDAVVEGVLTPERIAICAAVGALDVVVRRRPRIAVLSTGSELSDEPEAHQIRNSNGPMLKALFARADVLDLGAVPDEAGALEAAFGRGLGEADLVVSTGGVSKGELDLVRGTLEKLGLAVHVHGVQLQPGKPFLFGTKGDKAAFGLPGNPVSALVCADLFVLPFVAARGGRAFDEVLATRRARLLGPVTASPKRRRVLPCRLSGDEAQPLPWRSSADVYALTYSNAYVTVDVGYHLAEGAEVTCLVPERSAARTA